MRFFQLVRGDDAPQFSVVEYRGKRVAFSDVWKLKRDRDDDLVFEIALGDEWAWLLRCDGGVSKRWCAR